MKLRSVIAAASAAIALSAPSFASEDLAKANGCTACHQLDKKVIGPAYGQVAACYASKDAKKLDANKAVLVKHVIEGGSGVYGAIPMPAHPQLKEGAKNAELVKIIDWIMKDVKATECPKEFKPKG
ncbi:MAG: c-type cytochrome [Casimicrobium sp.]